MTNDVGVFLEQGARDWEGDVLWYEVSLCTFVALRFRLQLKWLAIYYLSWYDMIGKKSTHLATRNLLGSFFPRWKVGEPSCRETRLTVVNDPRPCNLFPKQLCIVQYSGFPTAAKLQRKMARESDATSRLQMIVRRPINYSCICYQFTAGGDAIH